MIDTKKEQEREELHRTIWGIANDLRGSVDGWDFKQYVLGMLFYRYISENFRNYINEGEIEAGNDDFDYAKLSDEEAEGAREDLVATKGFFILPSELFENVRARAMDDENLNETLEKVFNNIELSAQGSDSEDDFKGLFDDIDVNSNKLGATVAKRNDKLVKLMDGVASMKLGNYKDNTIDAFGDAYEFLMGMYASNAGKSGGEYYTPQEVSELLTKIALGNKTEVNKVYDPACGSGSLLLKAAKILGKENVRQGFYGQEINLTTYNLCRINMFLHDIDFDKFNIANEDTLLSPQHWDEEPFEVIVSNPPYSTKWEGDSNPLMINDPRFSPAGVLAPKSKADLAFIMHSLAWLSTNGTASIVCFPGVMYRGGAEQKIRKYLVDNNYIDCIIQLPDNLFYGTSIATCIMVLKKSKQDSSVLFIDATKECVKVTNSNKLTAENIEAIYNCYMERSEREYFSKVVTYGDVAEQDYNLSVSTYVEHEDTREVIDIKELNQEIQNIVAREQVLRDEIEKVIEEIEKGELFTFGDDVEHINLGMLAHIKTGSKPDEIYESIEEYEYINAGTTNSGYVNDYNCEDAVTTPSRGQGGIGFVGYHKGKFWLGPLCYRIQSRDNTKVLNKYLYYYLLHNNHLLLAIKKEGGVPAVNRVDIERLVIEVPSIAEQQRIVDILDRFDRLCNDISEGLPAEIEARQKQYEYYRDKLLTFKSLSLNS